MSDHTIKEQLAATQDFVPKAAYISREFAQLEKQRLWPRTWLLACREEEVASPGRFVTFEIADETIIITRDNDGDLRAFFNVCPHRGRRLVDGCGKTAGFFCKYHGWRWKLDGSNDGMIDGEDWAPLGKEHFGLRPVRHDTWGGFVFVNIDGEAEPLLDYLHPWPEMWKNYRLEDMRLRWFKTTRLNCNWKVAIEAFLEGYHAQTTHSQINPANGGDLYDSVILGRHSMFHDRHPKQLGAPNPNLPLLPKIDSDRFARAADRLERIAIYFEIARDDLDCFVTEELLRAARRLPERVGPDSPLPEIGAALRALHIEEAAASGVSWDHLPPAEQVALGVDWNMFPNVIMLPTADGLLIYRGRPDGDDPNKCLFDIFPLQRYAPGKQPKVQREFYDSWEDGNFPRIFAQDFVNVSEVQKGMQSAGFPGAYTNPRAERTIYHLHSELRRIVEGDER